MNALLAQPGSVEKTACKWGGGKRETGQPKIKATCKWGLLRYDQEGFIGLEAGILASVVKTFNHELDTNDASSIPI